MDPKRARSDGVGAALLEAGQIRGQLSNGVPRVSIHSLDSRRSLAEGTRPDDPRGTGVSYVRHVLADLPSK